MSRFLPVLPLILVLAACGERTPPPPSAGDDPDAATVAARLDSDLQALASTSAQERVTAELAFGARLERDLTLCQGSRYENKPLYLLAQWTMVHGGEDAPQRVLTLLDRLEVLPLPAYHNAGRALRVAALLRLGRSAEARQLAERLEQEFPEFGAMALVSFYGLVGAPAPPLPGIPVGGQTAEQPAQVLLVMFIATPDDLAGEQVVRYRDAIAPGRGGMVVVATGGDLLAAATASTTWKLPVRWVREGDPVLTGSWRLARLPASLLLGPGPQRVILAVNPSPGELRQVAGPAR